MKSSKYTQATESIILDNGKDFTAPTNSSNLNIARTFSDGQFQNVNNSEELLLKGSYDEYNRESLFEMQRFNSPERNPTRYLVAGQDFELVCNCAPRSRSTQLFNSEQNIVLSANRSFQQKPEHPENYSQFSLDRKLQKKCQPPPQHHHHQPSPGGGSVPYDTGTLTTTPRHHANVRVPHPEVITVHRAGYESLAHTYIPNHVVKHGDFPYEQKEFKEFTKGPEEHFGSFRRIKRDFGRSSNRSYRGVSTTRSADGGGSSSSAPGKRRPAADGTDSEPEVDDPELAVFELSEHLGSDCRCACDQLAYSPAYTTCIADLLRPGNASGETVASSFRNEERFPPAPDVTRRLGTPTLTGKPEVTFYRSNSTPGTSQSSSTGSGSSRMDLSSRHWWVIVTVLLLAAAAGVGVPIALRISAGASFEERLEFASRLLHDTPLVDGHNDLPWNIRKFLHNRLKDFKFGEDLRNVSPWSQSAWSHTDLPRLKRGHVAAQFWAAYVPCEAQHRDAVQLTLEQIDVIRRLTEQYQPSLTLCTSAADIKSAHENQQMCSLIGVEGGHSLASSLAVLRTLYHVGVRYLTLTSTCNTPWADCSYADMPGRKAEHGGLTSFGKSVVKEMNRLGMIVDLSHVSVGTMRDALDVSKAPVIFSHSSAHALCNSTRNVPDATLRKLALNKGIIMVNFYSHFLTCKDDSTVADAVAHINHIREIAGVDNVGLGAGYDGINFTPKGLEDVSSYPTLFAELIGTGKWSPEDLQKLAGLNFLRVFQDVERVRDEFRHAKVPPYEDVITPRPKDNNCSSQDLF